MPLSAEFLAFRPQCDGEPPRLLCTLASRSQRTRAFLAPRTAAGLVPHGFGGSRARRALSGCSEALSVRGCCDAKRRRGHPEGAELLAQGVSCSPAANGGSFKRARLLHGPWHNKAIDTDVLSAGVRRPLSAGHFYVMPRSAELLVLESQCDLEWLRPARKLASRVRRVRALRAPRTAVGCSFRGFVGRREQCVLWGSSEPLSVWGRCDAEGSRRHPPGPDARARSVCRFPAASGGSLKRARPLHRLWHNMAIDTDVLSAGFRRPTVRRSFLR
jgi:hypothetical protein